jgi:hypothetical protein
MKLTNDKKWTIGIGSVIIVSYAAYYVKKKYFPKKETTKETTTDDTSQGGGGGGITKSELIPNETDTTIVPVFSAIPIFGKFISPIFSPAPKLNIPTPKPIVPPPLPKPKPINPIPSNIPKVKIPKNNSVSFTGHQEQVL